MFSYYDNLEAKKPGEGRYGLERALGSISSARAGIGFTTWGHTGVDVNLYSFGPGSDQIRGSMENSDVGLAVERVMGFRLEDMTPLLKTPIGVWT